MQSRNNNIKALEKNLEDVIYEDSVEQKVALLKSISQHPDREVIYHNNRVVMALTRTLSEEHTKNQDLTKVIMLFLFEYMQNNLMLIMDEPAYGEETGDSEKLQTILNLMDILNKIQKFENRRFKRMWDKHTDLKKKSKLKPAYMEKYIKETRHLKTVMAKQNQTFCISLAFVIDMLKIITVVSEEELEEILKGSVEKIVNYMLTYLKLIVPNIDRKEQTLILLTLKTISEIVNLFGVPDDFSDTYFSLRLMRFFENQVYLTPYLIFAQMYNEGAFSEAELKWVTPSILTPTSDKYFRDNTSNLVSLISGNSAVKETLIEKEYFLGILKLYLKTVEIKMNKGEKDFSRYDLMRSLCNSMMNLANHPGQANLMISNVLFKKLLQYAFDTKDIGLLKVVNNVTRFCDPEHTKNFEEKALLIRDALLEIIPLTEETRDQAFEMMGILSNFCLGANWEGFLTKKILSFFNQQLRAPDGPMRLQTILLLSQIVQNEKIARLCDEYGTLKILFEDHSPTMDREELFQRLFVAYQLTLSGFSIEKYLLWVCNIIRSFLLDEFQDRVLPVVSFLNEFLFILQVKFKHHSDVEELVVKR